MRLSWLWPTIIILSAVAVCLVTFVIPDTPLRPIVVFWFLFVCPGMMVVRFLHLNEPVAEWTLAFALSFSIDALVAGIMLYVGRWSPTGILIILIGFSLNCAILQLALLLTGAGIHATSGKGKSSATISLQKSTQVVPFWNHRRLFLSLFAVLITLLIGLGVGIGLSFYPPSSHSPPSSVPQLGQASPHPTKNPISKIISTPAPKSSYPKIAKLYRGTLHNIPTNTTTEISLTGIQQQQGNISGYFAEKSASNRFTGLPENGPFRGSVNTTKRMQFKVMSASGQAAFSFEGIIQVDNNIAGSYCSLEKSIGECSSYGLWSISPGV
jgi:hypothetical protein